jgi:hypothetical protein
MTYYISIADQVRQLEELGFSGIDAVGLNGDWLRLEDYPARRDGWIYYMARSSLAA